MGGPLAPGGVSAEDVAVICTHLAAEHGLRTLIRPNPLLAEQWRAAGVPVSERIPRVAHVLDLGGGFDSVWSDRFAGGARTNVRKAEKTGVLVEHGRSPRHIEAFYELFEQSLLRWASRQPRGSDRAHYAAGPGLRESGIRCACGCRWLERNTLRLCRPDVDGEEIRNFSDLRS